MPEEYDVKLTDEFFRQLQEEAMIKMLLSFVPDNEANEFAGRVLRAFSQRGVSPVVVMEAFMEAIGEGGLDNG